MKQAKIKQYERAAVMRIRLGLSQAQFAKMYGMSRGKYILVENGRACFKYNSKLNNDIDKFFNISHIVKSNERCMILRKRMGWSQTDAAKAFSKSSNWISLMELGEANCKKYLEYLKYLSNANPNYII